LTDKREEDQEPNFEIIDRRRVSDEEPPPQESAPEEPSAEQPSPSDEAQESQDSQEAAGTEAEREPEPEEAAEARAMSAEDIVTMSIGLLQQQAWVNMGLVMNPATKAVTRDLEQAKLAIDAVAALVNLIAPRVDADVRRELQAMVSDLQVNFVQQQQ
jgi:hypothetical protein